MTLLVWTTLTQHLILSKQAFNYIHRMLIGYLLVGGTQALDIGTIEQDGGVSHDVWIIGSEYTQCDNELTEDSHMLIVHFSCLYSR